MIKKVKKFKMRGWVSHKHLQRCVVFTKPKDNCVEVMIEFVPIKEKNGGRKGHNQKTF